ncbi:hypothetical protein [Vibrio aestuarianus]|uniref:Uncharacterized protein n=1 Tax=Vibrio aestuarianus TaxID=28171 RepID=A0A9X4EXV3_9VIBR|nr:hypothetical protein [Vibrio aestuarianus]MDE1244231.1 hypothetical protein [Vibrio aestuarianus]
MLDRTNEYFLRGVAIIFFLKAALALYVALKEEFAVAIIIVSVATLLLLCTTVVVAHSLAIKFGGSGFEPDSKWLPGIMGAISVHSESYFSNTAWMQSLNDITQVFIAFSLAACMAFFSTYNLSKVRRDKSNESQ